MTQHHPCHITLVTILSLNSSYVQYIITFDEQHLDSQHTLEIYNITIHEILIDYNDPRY